MTRTLFLLTAIVLVASCGVVQGLWTNRWNTSHQLEDAAARLDQAAVTLQGWRGESQELDQDQLEAGDIAGHLMRRFVNTTDGTAVSALVVCGQPGPISVHTPEICYAGAGYAQKSAATKITVDLGPGSRPAEFQVCDFIKQGAVIPTRLRIYWAWTPNGAWGAPENPRLFYAPHAALYKLYVVRELVGADARTADQDPSLDLTRALLPELNRVLFPDEPERGRARGPAQSESPR